MLQEFKKAGVEHNVEDLMRPRKFDIAANLPDRQPASLTCNKAVTLDTELHIRHGSAPTLRGVRWLVTTQSVGDSLLGRLILEALGVNTRSILEAAAERHANLFVVSNLYGMENSTKRAARSLGFSEAYTTTMQEPTMQISTMTTVGLTWGLKTHPKRKQYSFKSSSSAARRE